MDSTVVQSNASKKLIEGTATKGQISGTYPPLTGYCPLLMMKNIRYPLSAIFLNPLFLL